MSLLLQGALVVGSSVGYCLPGLRISAFHRFVRLKELHEAFANDFAIPDSLRHCLAGDGCSP